MNRIKNKINEWEKKDVGGKLIIIIICCVCIPAITFIIGIGYGAEQTLDYYVGLIPCESLKKITDHNHQGNVWSTWKDKCLKTDANG